MSTSLRLSPQAVLELTNQTGFVFSIDEDPDAPDSEWMTAPDTGASVAVRVSFPAPGGNLVGAQNFRALVRKVGGSNNPTAGLELWENGSLLSAGSLSTISGSTVISLTWLPSLLSDITGGGVEAVVVGTAAGGSPSKRSTIELGAVEWNSVYDVQVPSKFGTVAVSSGGVVASTGRSARVGSVSIVSGGAATATGQSRRVGSVAISSGGVVTSMGSQLLQVVGSVLISAGGLVAAAGRKGAAGVASVASGGLTVASGRKAALGASVVSTGGSVASQGKKSAWGNAIVSGSGVVTASGLAGRIGSAAISAGGQVLSIGYRVGSAIVRRDRIALLMGVGR